MLLANAPAGAFHSGDRDSSAATPPSVLDLADRALSARGGSSGSAGLGPEGGGFATARTLLGLLGGSDTLPRALTLAEEATRAQTHTMDLPWNDPVLPAHASPSEAAIALLARYRATPTPEQQEHLLALDALPGPAREAVTGVFDAFLAFDAAVRAAYAHADAAKLLALAPLDAAGVEPAPVFPARNALLDAAGRLHGALPVLPAGTMCSPVAVPPVFSIDLSTCDNTYTADVALLLDAGGHDLYLNNAGGNDILGVGCGLILHAAAALIDLAGDDRYVSGRDCGVNGGARLGAGFLLDAAGNDTYAAGSFGTNGGDYAGFGFLVDAEGDDTYTAGDHGTNGGGWHSSGFLIDAGGDDTYTAGSRGTNGGGSYSGRGFLLDAGGDDTYVASGGGANGGGGDGGIGLLLDGGGDDTYAAGDVGANGGGGDGGVGFLLDAGGDDTYTAGDEGTNGGGEFGGWGFLIDASGNDTYTAGGEGANGGGSREGRGFLIDASGNDAYTAGSRGTNGGAASGSPSFGLLLDAGGLDRYLDALVDCTDCAVVPKGLAGAQVDSAGVAPFP